MAKTILAIEDEQALQKTLEDIFRQEGFNFISALNGETGIRAAKEQSPDLILLDLVIPREDGFSVLAELKRDEKTKDIPVIVLTNLEEMKDVQRILELGATTYLVKSNYSLEEIVEKTKEILAQ